MPKAAPRLQSEFRLYTRIRQYQGEDTATFSLESIRIYKDEKGNVCTDKSLHNVPEFGLWAYPLIGLKSFQPDHYAPRVRREKHPRLDPCNAALCKPENDKEYCRLVAREKDAASLDAKSYLGYYQQVKQIFVEWYHEHSLQLPDCSPAEGKDPLVHVPYEDETPDFTSHRSNSHWLPFGRFIINRFKELNASGLKLDAIVSEISLALDANFNQELEERGVDPAGFHKEALRRIRMAHDEHRL